MAVLMMTSLTDEHVGVIAIPGTIKGTEGDDTIDGTASNDVIKAKGGADVVFGHDGADKIFGGDGGDALYGGTGNDKLLGEAGNDYLAGGDGDDTLDGGDGLDRAAFYDSSSGVHVTLQLQGVAQDTGAGMDTLIGIENLSGTVDSDQLVGDDGDNWLWGSVSGNDTLTGAGGDDLLTAGFGDHILDGGAGVDTVRLDDNFSDTFASGVMASLRHQGVAHDTSQGWMTFISIENLSGSRFGDLLDGNGKDNILAGGDGSDGIGGGGGNDALYGDGQIDADGGVLRASGPITATPWLAPSPDFAGGDDYLDGGAGSDTLVGGIGQDTMRGNVGADFFVFYSVLDSTVERPDLIEDMTKLDTIDLSRIDADVTLDGDQAFVEVKHFTGHAGELTTKYDAEADVTRVLMDVDGDRVADSEIDLTGKIKFDPFVL